MQRLDRSMPVLLWVLFASSSIVLIEPAPYDLLAICLIFATFSLGLTFPREIGTGAFFLGLFVIGNTVAAALSDDPLSTLFSFSVRTYLVLTWFLIVSSVAIDPERMIGYVWKGYVVAALIAVGWGLLEFLGLLPYADTDPVRVQGPFKDPNVLAPFLTPAAVYSIHRVFQIGMRGLAWNVSVFLICSFGIFLSFSRGGWLNLVLSFGIYVTLAVFFSRTIREKFALVLIAPTAAFLAVTITLVALSSSEDLARFLAQRAVLVQSYDVEEGGRFASTLAALREVGQNPIGVGPGRTAIEFGLAPHNLYVHILAEGGWLAAFGFYGFVVLTLSRCLSLIPKDLPMKRDAILVSACLLGTLTQSLFIDATHWRHLWLLLALAWVPSIASQRYRVQRQRYVMSNAV